MAAKSGLVIESRNTQASLATIGTVATAAGALIALGVLAMAVGLIRAEAASDVRTLTAIGFASATRRTLTATTAGSLALLGALLGSGAAYPALAAGHRSDIGVLSRVPVLDLAITVVGVPPRQPWPAGFSPGANHHQSPGRRSTDSLTDVAAPD